MNSLSETLSLWRGVARFVLVLLLLAGFASISFAEGRLPAQQKTLLKPAVLVDPNAVITISGDMNTITKEALAQSLVGSGIQISNVTATCDPTAAGTFTITGNAGIGLSSGIVLGSGAVTNVIGPNSSSSVTTSFGSPGDADLDAILATGTGSKTSHDACVMEFDFIPQKSVVSFSYVFGSDEYNEYVNTSFNDVFGFFVNGQNCAIINDYPVSINNINNGKPFGTGGPNSDYYINNDAWDPSDGSGNVFNTQLDGFTKVLTCSATVNPGVTNHIKLAIADAGDSAYDSDVFIGASSFVSADYSVAISPSVQSKSGNNTTTATYVFEVKNLGAKAEGDSFNLTLNATGSLWPTVFSSTGTKSMTVGPLFPLESTFVYVDVTIPKEPSSSFDSATLTATSVGAGTINPVTATATMTTEALGLNNCLFVRDLPSFYIPGIPMPVSILAVPTCIKAGDNFWALEDNVPPGWAVTNISNNGVFVGGKVNFDSLPAEETILTYTVTPPVSQVGTVTFAGTGSVSGMDTPITGDSQAEYNAGDHPADTNGNKAIAIGEYTTYGSYWKSGKEWPLGWNPITAAFVTKAAEIWAKNIGYHFNATAGICPDCWVAGPATVAAKIAQNGAAGSLTRNIAAIYQPGVDMNVDLNVAPPTGTQAYAVEETPPSGWAVKNISNNGSFDGINKKIKWGIFKDAVSRTLSYTVTPAANATGAKTFTGLASFDGVNVLADSTVSDLVTHNVKYISGGNGTITGNTDQTVTHGGNATAVTAVPAVGYTFVNWTGTGGFVTTTSNPLTVTNVTTDQTITANFKIITHKVVFASGGNGSISGNADQTVNHGSNATAVTAVPAEGYAFVNWTGTGGFVTTTSNPLTVTNVTADQTITAHFTVAVQITSKPAKLFKFKGGKGKLAFTALNTLTLQQIKDAISWDDDFISIDKNLVKFAKGKGSLSYVVAPNPTTDVRDGEIRIGDKSFNVSQGSTPCMIKSVTVWANNVLKGKIPKAGGELKMAVDVYPDTCKWEVLSAKVAPCPKGTDPNVCLNEWFVGETTFPDIGEDLTGDKTFTGTVSATEKPRTLSGKIVIVNPPAGKGTKPFTAKQLAK